MSEETLLKFPCSFPIKAMGKANIELDILVIDIVHKHAPDTEHGALRTRLSKDGNYLAVTITIQATSKQQLDAIYQELTDHPHILWAI